MPVLAPGQRLTYAQLEGLWITAGGPRSQAPLAAAIALAESQGNPGAVNPNDNNGTQTSWGLWQISNGTHSAPSPRWAVPLINARLAVAKWRAAGDSFSPWGTYTSGAYKQYISNGTTPDFSAAAGPGSTPFVSAPNFAGNPDPGCLVPFRLPQLSSPKIPLVGGISAGGGQVCILRKSQARAMLGGLLIAGGGLILFGGAAVLISRGLEQTRNVQMALSIVGANVARPARAARSIRGRAPEPETPAAEPERAPAAPATRSGTVPPPARPSRPPRAPGTGPSKAGTRPPRPRTRRPAESSD